MICSGASPPSTVKRRQHRRYDIKTHNPPTTTTTPIITIHPGALKKLNDCFYKLALFLRGVEVVGGI